MVPWVEQALDDPVVRSRLEAEGFAVVPGTSPLFHYVYDVAVYEGNANYVTTDAVFHTWHLVFDKVLRDTESGALLPVLERLVGRLDAGAMTRLNRVLAALEEAHHLGIVHIARVYVDRAPAANRKPVFQDDSGVLGLREIAPLPETAEGDPSSLESGSHLP